MGFMNVTWSTPDRHGVDSLRPVIVGLYFNYFNTCIIVVLCGRAFSQIYKASDASFCMYISSPIVTMTSDV